MLNFNKKKLTKLFMEMSHDQETIKILNEKNKSLNQEIIENQNTISNLNQMVLQNNKEVLNILKGMKMQEIEEVKNKIEIKKSKYHEPLTTEEL